MRPHKSTYEAYHVLFTRLSIVTVLVSFATSLASVCTTAGWRFAAYQFKSQGDIPVDPTAFRVHIAGACGPERVPTTSVGDAWATLDVSSRVVGEMPHIDIPNLLPSEFQSSVGNDNRYLVVIGGRATGGPQGGALVGGSALTQLRMWYTGPNGEEGNVRASEE